MSDEVTIDASGRLVIPKAVRRRHDLAAGTRLLLIEDDDRLILVPLREAVAEWWNGLLIFRGRLVGPVPDHRLLRDQPHKRPCLGPV
jgi:AbrB family looped-hinge helix DNA binding protein